MDITVTAKLPGLLTIGLCNIALQLLEQTGVHSYIKEAKRDEILQLKAAISKLRAELPRD